LHTRPFESFWRASERSSAFQEETRSRPSVRSANVQPPLQKAALTSVAELWACPKGAFRLLLQKGSDARKQRLSLLLARYLHDQEQWTSHARERLREEPFDSPGRVYATPGRLGSEKQNEA
jgi:hypothetical protein